MKNVLLIICLLSVSCSATSIDVSITGNPLQEKSDEILESVTENAVSVNDEAAIEFLTEEEYLDILDKQPLENQYLSDDDPKKFVAKMGAEAIHNLLAKLDLDDLSYTLRNKAANETSQQRKTEALKR